MEIQKVGKESDILGKLFKDVSAIKWFVRGDSKEVIGPSCCYPRAFEAQQRTKALRQENP